MFINFPCVTVIFNLLCMLMECILIQNEALQCVQFSVLAEVHFCKTELDTIIHNNKIE